MYNIWTLTSIVFHFTITIVHNIIQTKLLCLEVMHGMLMMILYVFAVFYYSTGLALKVDMLKSENEGLTFKKQNKQKQSLRV